MFDSPTLDAESLAVCEAEHVEGEVSTRFWLVGFAEGLMLGLNLVPEKPPW